MQNKFIKKFLVFGLFFALNTVQVFADVPMDENVSEVTDDTDVSADAVAGYDVNNSLFQQITDLEQEKILMGLEKDRAQMDLELDRLAAEKVKLHMEMNNLKNKSDEQKQNLADQAAKLAEQEKQLELQKKQVANGQQPSQVVSVTKTTDNQKLTAFNKKYKLVNIIGAGTQLQASVQDLETGQNKKLSVGKVLDGYTVKSISLDEGVVVTKDNDTETLNIGNGTKVINSTTSDSSK